MHCICLLIWLQVTLLSMLNVAILSIEILAIVNFRSISTSALQLHLSHRLGLVTSCCNIILSYCRRSDDIENFWRHYLISNHARRVQRTCWILFAKLATRLVTFVTLALVCDLMLDMADDDALDFRSCHAVMGHQASALTAQLPAHF